MICQNCNSVVPRKKEEKSQKCSYCGCNKFFPTVGEALVFIHENFVLLEEEENKEGGR